MLTPSYSRISVFPLIAWQSRASYDALEHHGECERPVSSTNWQAILAANVVGYSRLMGRNEGGTLARLTTL